LSYVAAVDLGATSGRVIVFGLDESGITSDEMHRFANQAKWVDDRLVWDFPYLLSETITGLKRAREKYPLVSCGVDSWAVDYGVIDENNQLLGPVYAYRDPRHDDGMAEFYTRMTWPKHYSIAGIQKIALNTVYQLTGEAGSKRLSEGYKVLLVPDLIANQATGYVGCEISNASHTAMLDARTHRWSPEVLSAASLPSHLLADVVQPGTGLGTWRDKDLEGLPLVSVASHDTGSAFVAVPFNSERPSLVVNLGTWALIGTELSHPVLTDSAREANFTNEIGYGSTTRFLKNVTGMWILEQIRAEMLDGGKQPDIELLLSEMQGAKAFASHINPDDPVFGPPGGMVERIRQNVKGDIPSNRSEFVRCVLESLVARVAQRVGLLGGLTNTTYQEIVAVGGGSRMDIVCQWLADATQMPVVTGPTEATALGNSLVQWLANGDLSSLAQGRELVKQFAGSRHYSPKQSRDGWLPLIEAMP